MKRNEKRDTLMTIPPFLVKMIKVFIPHNIFWKTGKILKIYFEAVFYFISGTGNRYFLKKLFQSNRGLYAEIFLIIAVIF